MIRKTINIVVFILVLSPREQPWDVFAYNGLKKIVKQTIIREVVAQWFVLPYTEQ